MCFSCFSQLVTYLLLHLCKYDLDLTSLAGSNRTRTNETENRLIRFQNPFQICSLFTVVRPAGRKSVHFSDISIFHLNLCSKGTPEKGLNPGTCPTKRFFHSILFLLTVPSVICWYCFLEMGHPWPLFHSFSSFQTNITILTTNKCENVHQVYSAGIWTYDNWNLSLLE